MKLSSAGRRALEIVDAAPGCTLYAFAASYWSELEAVGPRLSQARIILDALAEEGLVSKSISFGRHGSLYTLTLKGKEAIA